MSDEAETGRRRLRKKAPKVRTGCNTCRVRRVKCDETKPQCIRCIKFGVGVCDGYERPLKPVKGQLNRYKTLQPASLRQLHAGPKFNDDEEYCCFHIFRIDTIPCLAGSFSDSLWGRIIAQASENEPFVLDCAIAIGSLSRAATLPEDCPALKISRNMSDSPYGNKAYRYALRQYGKALKAMRTALSDGQQNLRRALIACLLVFCFESYIGNQVAAITHAQSGISLLHQWKPPRKTLTTNILSPAPHVVEDELVQAFTRLDLQVSILLDTRPLKLHQIIKDDCYTTLQKMPPSFQTLDQARIWCELLMRWNYHFRAESATVGKTQEISMKCSPIIWEDSMDTPMGATVLHDPKEVPVALLPEYRAHVSKTEKWFLAFEPLLQSLQISKGKDLVGGTLLQVQAKMSSITLASAFFQLETGYDFFLREFRDIIALTESISSTLLTHTHTRLSYQFDGGFVPPLFLVATKCRDRALRRKAIALVSSAPMREGVFDSICVAKMAEWIVALEEEGIAEGEIPDHRRLRLRRSNIDLPMRRAQLQVTQYKNADDIEPEWKETVLVW